MKKLMAWGKLVLYISLLLSALAFVLPTSVYEFDLLQSFAVHALAGYLGLTLLLVLFRQWFLSLSAGGAVVVLLLFLSPFVLPSDPVLATEGRPFTVAHFNVLRSNRQYDATIRQALASRADLLSFQEVNQRWADQLVPRLCEEYPYYQVTVETRKTQGLAIFSRYPLKDVEVRYWAETPNIIGTVDLTKRAATGEEMRESIMGDTIVHFVASHTLSPRSEWRYQRRNEHIRQIAHYIRSVDAPVLAIGDYNAVPWNPSIASLKQEARLSDSRRGITPTFPSRLKDGGIPIDYVFHSDDFVCADFRAVQAGGSDHRGVVGTYWLKQPAL